MSMDRIYPIDMRSIYGAHRDEIDSAIRRVLESGTFILGEEVAAFEREFASFIGDVEAIGVASGTDALELALTASGIERGDEVIAVSHSAVATVAAIDRTGAVPVLVDIDSRTFTIDLDKLQATLSQRRSIRAVVPVHLYGHPVDVRAIRDLTGNDVMIIEDAAQAHGGSRDGSTIGSVGDAAAFSFYPTKNLGAFGDGGAVVTREPEIASKVRSLRQYGWDRRRYVSEVPGMNSRLDEIQAALLRIRLSHLKSENEIRRKIAEGYEQHLQGIGDLILPLPAQGHVFHQYVIRSSQRDRLKGHLSRCGIETLIHYPVPIHMQPAYASRFVAGAAGLAETEAVSREIVSLPIHPWLAERDQDRVIQAIRSFFSSS